MPPTGIDGAEDAGAIDDDDFIPGIDGALPILVLEEGFPERTPPVPVTLPSIIGALLSFVMVCLSFFPFLMSLSNASFPNVGGGRSGRALLLELPNPGGGPGGGGGPPKLGGGGGPAMMNRNNWSYEMV